MMSHSKKKKKKSSSNNVDSSIEQFHEFDLDVEFLLLDDVLPTDRSEGRRKINLREEHLRRSGSDDNNMNVTDVINSTTTPPDVTLLSLGGVMSTTRMADQNGTFMISRQSLDRASPSAMSRMLMSNLQGGGGGGAGIGGGGENAGGGGGNLRLLAGICDVAQNGALLMPGTKTSIFVNGEAAHMTNEEEEEIQIFPGGLSRNDNIDDSLNDFAATDSVSFHGGSGDNYWGGDDNDGVGFELNEDENMADSLEDNNQKEKEKEEDFTKTANILNRKKESSATLQQVDPWAVLDIHETSKEKAVPLRIGVTTRLPAELDDDDRPSKAVTGSRTRIKKTTKSKKKSDGTTAQSEMNDFQSRPFLADITLDEALRDDDDKRLDNSDESLQLETSRHLRFLQTNGGLIFGDEFAYVAKMHAKFRKQRRLQQKQEWEEKEAGQPNLMDVDDCDDEHGYGGAFDFGGGDDDSFGQPDKDEPLIHRSNVDFNAIDDVFASSGGGGGFDVNDFDSGVFDHNSQATFEDLCRAHLRRFNESAKVYAAETKLTKRVGVWQAGLAPLLDEQEKRPEFDIHSYGRKILEKISNKVEQNQSVRKRISTGEKKLESTSIEFSTIVAEDVEDYEVCRLFLSTLMLCNCGNVAVCHGEDSSMGSLSIELLNSSFETPTFVAPSVDVYHQNENSLPCA